MKHGIQRFVYQAGILFLGFSLMFCAGGVRAGILDDFEKEATKDQVPRPAPTIPREPDEDEDEGCWDLLFEACMMAFCSLFLPDEGDTEGPRPEPRPSTSLGSAALDPVEPPLPEPRPLTSLERAALDPSEPPPPKPEKALPTVYARLALGNMTSDVTAWDGFIQIGHKGLAGQYRHTHFQEKEPKDTLDMGEAHVLYRLAFPYVDMGLGAGLLHLRGNESNSGFSFTLPINVDFNKSWGVSWRPVWSEINGNRIYDQEVGVRVSRKTIGLEGGYRWVGTDNVRMKGPCFGVSAQF